MTLLLLVRMLLPMVSMMTALVDDVGVLPDADAVADDCAVFDDVVYVCAGIGLGCWC